MSFELTRMPDMRACLVAIRGDIDLALVPELQIALASAIEGGAYNVILDLSEVTYADSSALGMLVWLDSELRDLEGKVVLAGASSNVSRILELSGLITVAETVCTESSAEEALQGLEVFSEAGEPLFSRSLTMPASVEHLAVVREHISEMISDLGFSDAAQFDIKVALGEALANAVRHGSPGGLESEIEVGVRVYDEHIALDVQDSGSGFDGEHPCSDDLYAAGGRGIMFMRALMDRVQFTQVQGGGTIVTLIKHRSPVEVP